MNIKIGETLRMLREAKELKLKNVAEESNVSTPFLTLVEQGRRQPSLEVLRKIAAALNVPVEAIILSAQSSDGSMRSSDERAERIVESVKKLKLLQDALKRELESDHVEPT